MPVLHLESSVLSHMPFMMNYMMKILRKLDKDTSLTYKGFISYLIISLIEEDRIGGDLNFCSYYENEQAILDRMKHFVEEAEKSIGDLPHAKFHRLISRGLLGIYLSDRKVSAQKNMHKMARRIVKYGGLTSRFFYWNGKMYRKKTAQ